MSEQTANGALQVLGVPVRASEAVPPDEVWVKQDGKAVARIVNLSALPSPAREP